MLSKTMRHLPEPKESGEMSVETAIAKRRSVRSYTDTPLSDEVIGQLLWAAQGVTEPGEGFRAAPSAGATYPLETYVVTGQGVLHYLPEKHAVEQHLSGDRRPGLTDVTFEQEFVAQASATVVFAAVFQRTTEKYGELGDMFVHMEAGHAAQNVHLQAMALGLESVPVCAFKREGVTQVLELPAEQTPLYLVSVGR